jgi:hypothetical protein
MYRSRRQFFNVSKRLAVSKAIDDEIEGNEEVRVGSA